MCCLMQDYSKNQYDLRWGQDCWYVVLSVWCPIALLPPNQRTSSRVDQGLPAHVRCRWGKPVIVFGEEGLRKDHPVVKFLAEENKCKSLSIYRPGCGTSADSSGCHTETTTPAGGAVDV
jgi:hypothetical protein